MLQQPKVLLHGCKLSEIQPLCQLPLRGGGINCVLRMRKEFSNLKNTKTTVMAYTLPHTIKNHLGEELIFHRIENENGIEKLIIESFVAPGAKPIMHTHHMQDESLTVLHGVLGYQIRGEDAKHAKVGETVTFTKGTPHRFWNAGEDELNCFGYIKPANNIIFYLTALFNALNESGTDKPDQFDGAYLLYRYRKEHDLPELPRFVKSVVIPATYTIGKLTGMYRKFQDAPKPVTPQKDSLLEEGA
jgi:quercetin dioxygenase-like cupin family protein